MIFQWKGKGILVLVYAFVPFLVLQILTSVVDDYFFRGKFWKEALPLVGGIALIVSGFWTFKTSDDFYLDDEGEKQYIYFEHRFMFLDMKIWAYIFWALGGFLLLGWIVEVIEKLT